MQREIAKVRVPAPHEDVHVETARDRRLLVASRGALARSKQAADPLRAFMRATHSSVEYFTNTDGAVFRELSQLLLCRSSSTDACSFSLLPQLRLATIFLYQFLSHMIGSCNNPGGRACPQEFSPVRSRN